MNDFLNGIFRIWDKLPDHSKEAFTKSLGVKQRSALQMGSQLLQYYATMAQQQAELEERIRQEENQNQNRSSSSRTYTYNTQDSSWASKSDSRREEDDDVIDVEWSDTDNSYQPVGKNNKRK